MNITGDPSNQNRPSVLGFDYTYPVDWTKFQLPPQPPGVLPTQHPGNDYGQHINFPQQNNFSFCTVERPALPVQFPFTTNPEQPTTSLIQPSGSFGSRPLHIPLRCKRKTDSPPPPAVKQHITDEKMAEHMSQLHISSETPVAAQPESQPAREQRLYMCEEMRRFQQDSILPQSLLNRINRPCTALVLWMPPPRIPVADEVTTGDNNNEECQQDNNVMDLDSMN